MKFFLILIMLFIISCGGIPGKILKIVNSDIGNQIERVEIQNVYEGFSNWNEYVLKNGTSRFNSDPVASCDPINHDDCVHGGELRKIILTEQSSCLDLWAEDSLNVLEWICDESGSSVVFYSKGVKIDKGLADLVTLSGWNALEVIVYKNSDKIAETEPAILWTNPIEELPENEETSVVVLEAPNYSEGTIFVMESSQTTMGYNINLDKIGFVALNDSVLNLNLNAINNCQNSGEAGTTNISTVCSGGHNFLWIEMKINGNKTGLPLYLSYGSTDIGILFTRIHKSEFFNSNNTANFYANKLLKSIISNTASHSSDFDGFQFSASTHNRFYMLKSSFNLRDGIYAHTNFNNNIFYKINTYNNIGQGSSSQGGIKLSSANENIFTQLVSTNNYHGIIMSSSERNTFIHATLNNNSCGGADIYSSSNYNTYTQIIASNNAANGLWISGASYNQFDNIVATHTGSGYGINLTSGSNNNSLTGNLLVGSNASDKNCAVAESTNNIATGCSTSDSNLQVHFNQDITNSFYGQVIVDNHNADMDKLVNGQIASNQITDFINFENPFRTWGRALNNSPLSSSNRNHCIGSTCGVWDWRIVLVDDVLLNFNGLAQEGEACPPSISGSVSITDELGHTFLVNAIEIINDDIGNDNTLCESNEACIYSPNIGAYQGEGFNLKKTCIFNNDEISNVTMYLYDTNGI